jgi:uncharacterized membrane protein (DUF4010 family)
VLVWGPLMSRCNLDTISVQSCRYLSCSVLDSNSSYIAISLIPRCYLIDISLLSHCYFVAVFSFHLARCYLDAISMQSWFNLDAFSNNSLRCSRLVLLVEIVSAKVISLQSLPIAITSALSLTLLTALPKSSPTSARARLPS